MKRTGGPKRKAPLRARVSLDPGSTPPRQREPVKRKPRVLTTTSAEMPAGMRRSAPIRPMSAKRAQQNRERAAMIAGLYPERPLCVVYELSQDRPGVIPAKVLGRCRRWADDVHEPLTRARGGSITDPGNATTPCRPCHGAVQLGPQWAYTLGLLKHSWDGEAA